MSEAPLFIGPSIESKLNWREAVEALRLGHQFPYPKIKDSLVEAEHGQLLTRAAWIEGMGYGVKAVTVSPENARFGHPSIQGLFLLFSDRDGRLEATIDGELLTKWKTVADSLLAARLLIKRKPKKLSILGAGAIATALLEGYCAYFGSLEEVVVWARNQEKAEILCSRFAARGMNVSFERERENACGGADIIASATGAREPILLGNWLKSGTYVDLVGAHTLKMREADDNLIAKADIFVDCKETAIADIGELSIPLGLGLISMKDIRGDLYEICASDFLLNSRKDIILFKNGGGAHLDLMMARHLAELHSLPQREIQKSPRLLVDGKR